MIIIAVILALMLVLVLIAATRPAHFRVSRSLSMTAPAERVFSQVNTLRHWETWNPWAKMDPNAKITYDGPASGIGASYTWKGNSKVGEGCNTIVDSRPSEFIRFRLRFIKPMAAVNNAEFAFKQEGTQTVVTWTMTGKNNFMGKLFSMLINCDKMIGQQFEKGLAAMKVGVETNNK